MTKWLGIRISAVLAILGSLFTLLMAGSMAFASLNSARLETVDSPIPIKAVMVGMALIFTAFAGWGIASAIGIFRHRNWARLSIIIFAVLLVGMGGSALIGILFIQLPPTGDVPPQTMQYVRIGIASVYGAMAVIGAWWLLLFNSQATKQYFAEQESQPGGRPLSITIIGWYLLICSLGTGIATILRVPAFVFGLVLTGWGALVIYTLFTAVQIYLGAGLLNLQESARIATLFFLGLLVANTAFNVLVPGFDARMRAAQQSFPSLARAAQAAPSFQGTGGLMLAGTLILLVPIWFLIARRSAFR